MRLALITLLFAFTVSAQNFDKDLKKLNNQNQECLDKGEDMLGCSRRYYVQIDSMLNVVYKNIKKELNKTQQIDLKNKQLAWIKNRDIKFKKLMHKIQVLETVWMILWIKHNKKLILFRKEFPI